MKITLKRPIALGFGLMSGQLDLKIGEHVIDDAWASDTFFQSLIASGDITMGSDVPETPTQLDYSQGPVRTPESGSIKNIEQKPVKTGTLKYDMEKVVFTESGPKKIEEPAEIPAAESVEKPAEEEKTVLKKRSTKRS